MATPYVQRHFWVDNSRFGVDSYQFLTDDKWAGIFTNFIAVLITTTSVPIFNLIKHHLIWASQKLISKFGKDRDESLDEATGFLDSILIQLRNLRPERPANQLPIDNPRKVSIRESVRQFFEKLLPSVVLLVITIGLPVALITASVLSSGLATDSTGRSISDLCGRYVYRATTTKSPVQFLEFEHKSESQADAYASNCYGSSPQVEQCTKFYNQSINYEINDSADCPYRASVCAGGDKSAFQLTTGLVSGSVLGINAVSPFLFSRTMTCSPLLSSRRNIRKGRSKNGVLQWEYYHGPSTKTAYTYANPVMESAWEIKGYSASVHCSHPWSKISPYNPLFEFSAGSKPVTVFYISSHSIRYPEPRSDPIFPADTEIKFNPNHPVAPQYFYDSTRATVLGCVDDFQICKSRKGPCWTYDNITSIPLASGQQQATLTEQLAYLILISLDSSTACGATRFRGAEALDAQSKIAHQQSLQLAPEQWKIEAEKIFRASLARIQLNAYDIVRGTAAAFEDYHNVMPLPYRAGICRLLTIKTVGWKNVNSLGFGGTVFAAVLVWVLGLKLRDGRNDEMLVAVFVWKMFLERPWRFIEMWVFVPLANSVSIFGVGLSRQCDDIELGENPPLELTAQHSN